MQASKPDRALRYDSRIQRGALGEGLRFSKCWECSYFTHLVLRPGVPASFSWPPQTMQLCWRQGWLIAVREHSIS